MKIKLLAYILAICLVICSVAAEAAVRIPIPEGIYYHRFGSISTGAEAVWANPAGLSAGPSIYIQYINEFRHKKITGSRGFVLTGEGIGIAYRSLDNYMGEDYREYTFSAGSALYRDFHVGFSYQYIKEGYGLYNKRHFWNGGILLDKYENVKLGAVFNNLNRGKVDGERSEIEQMYSVSLITSGGRLVLSTEITVGGNESITSGRYRFGFEYEASPTVRLFGMVDEDKFFQLGFRFGVGQYYGGLQSRFDSNSDHEGSSFYGGVNYSSLR